MASEPQSVEAIASTTDHVSSQIDQVRERLIADHPTVAPDAVREYVEDERKQFADAAVHVFVPILVERAVRERLAEP